ncbi:hypothetical protein [Gimesia aquarii]|uniref:Uncharacterized protein n=1 Tax=Gimesia aquarii TaxID=2527964 RepID=A0A517W4N2_9PLAN|nr:hypothetical protein [Gimesia aquarii]QDU00210.1 hypothetical protein V144x_57230 [Gimesia aquarii]
MDLSDSSSVSRRVQLSKVSEVERVEDRLSCLKAIFGTTIGVNESSFDWCPDGSPPSPQELLGWLWFLEPDINIKLKSQASGQLAKLMTAYDEDNLDIWWQQLLEQYD